MLGELAVGRRAVAVTVTNTGARAGVAVPQLQVATRIAPHTRPARLLRGFVRVAAPVARACARRSRSIPRRCRGPGRWMCGWRRRATMPGWRG
ncbi:hypothetical protein AB5I41_28300 [Sphingomonas sp. MMS24-JH45]